MSNGDYISKSELVEAVDKLKFQVCVSEEVGHNRPFIDFANVLNCIDNQPTLSETEIIRKAFERVVERLEERRSINDCRKCRHFTKNGDECNEDCTDALVDDLIEIVKEEGGIE